MNLALSTLMWARQPLDRCLECAAGLGIPWLDLGALPGIGHLSLGPADDVEAQGRRISEALPTGMQVVAVTADHGDIASTDEPARQAAVAFTRQALWAAQLLGAPVVGTSLGSIGTGRTWDEAAERGAQSLAEAIRSAPPGVRLAVEIHVADVCNSLERAEAILEAVADERVGICFDTSLLYHNRIPIEAAFDRLGERLLHVHLRGATNETYFAIPGRDDVDFATFLARLRQAAYAGALSLELYEVRERYGIDVCDALREAAAFLADLM